MIYYGKYVIWNGITEYMAVKVGPWSNKRTAVKQTRQMCIRQLTYDSGDCDAASYLVAQENHTIVAISSIRRKECGIEEVGKDSLGEKE